LHKAIMNIQKTILKLNLNMIIWKIMDLMMTRELALDANS
jgi:hypothetical protein